MRRSRRGGAREVSSSGADIRIGPGHAEVYYRNPLGSMIDRPVFVLDGNGVVLFVNPQGEQLLEHKSAEVLCSLSALVRSGWTDLPWILTCLHGSEQAKVFLAILQSPAQNDPTVDTVEAATIRWKLTPRQRQVLDLVAHGLTNVDTAKLLEIAESTVEYHLARIFDKAGVDNRATLIVRLLELSNGEKPDADAPSLPGVARLMA